MSKAAKKAREKEERVAKKAQKEELARGGHVGSLAKHSLSMRKLPLPAEPSPPPEVELAKGKI